MPTTQEINDWRGQKAVDNDGTKLGTIDDIYVDAETDRPEWMAIKTGLFGSKVSFVPLADAHRDGDHVRVPYDNDLVKDSPNADADGALSQEEEERLYRHYGLDYSEARSDTGLAASDGRDEAAAGDDPVGRDVSGPETDSAMTRSEEEMRVGTRERETGRARLRKYVVTENVQTTVPVSREEVRVEREPITDANRDQALAGGDLTEEEHEVTLHSEEVVVDKDVVAKERVRLDTETVTEEQTVSDEVRKERIETEGDVTERGER